ncbi:MAG TPA: co-chaperone DjlA [Gammaproteobacteria bacterium]|nr:co-chaperone DjlA [Gammaproteobacteria bacterium]
MQWLGKSIGGLIGAFVAGPVGSLLGVLVGHRWDETTRTGRGGVRAISQLFFEVTFEIMGHVAKVDGRVSEDEVRVARRIMHGMRLTDPQVQSAIEHFTRGKAAKYAFEPRLRALAEQLGGHTDLARAFVQIQLQSAIGAGQLGADKRQLLWRVADRLGVTRAELAQLEAVVRGFARGGAAQPTPAEALNGSYRVLGVSAEASDDEVKTAYRRLMSQHHPDKLVARGLPETMIGVAEQKTHEVRTAYERIKTQRGFK